MAKSINFRLANFGRSCLQIRYTGVDKIQQSWQKNKTNRDGNVVSVFKNWLDEPISNWKCVKKVEAVRHRSRSHRDRGNGAGPGNETQVPESE
jgi:hypothetical protein